MGQVQIQGVPIHSQYIVPPPVCFPQVFSPGSLLAGELLQILSTTSSISSLQESSAIFLSIALLYLSILARTASVLPCSHLLGIWSATGSNTSESKLLMWIFMSGPFVLLVATFSKPL